MLLKVYSTNYKWKIYKNKWTKFLQINCQPNKMLIVYIKKKLYCYLHNFLKFKLLWFLRVYQSLSKQTVINFFHLTPKPDCNCYRMSLMIRATIFLSTIFGHIWFGLIKIEFFFNSTKANENCDIYAFSVLTVH